MIEPGSKPGDLATGEIQLDMVERAGTGRGAKENLTPRVASHSGDARREISEPREILEIDDARGSSLFTGEGGEGGAARRLEGARESNGIELSVDLERQWLVGPVEKVTTLAHALIRVLGAIVVTPGGTRFLIGDHVARMITRCAIIRGRMSAPPEIRVVGIAGMPEVLPGSDLVGLVLDACRAQSLRLVDRDILIFTSKVISKAEGRLRRLSQVVPSPLARSFAATSAHDPRTVEVVLSESRRVVKMDRGILITETRQGLVCAQAGVDASNVPGKDVVALLPEEPDRSAQALRREIKKRAGASVAIVVSDTFGRPWREGLTNVAIGLSGLAPLLDYRGQRDPHGKKLKATVLAIADELAAAAELVMGKLGRIPVALVRGYRFRDGRGRAKSLVRPARRDLFR